MYDGLQTLAAIDSQRVWILALCALAMTSKPKLSAATARS